MVANENRSDSTRFPILDSILQIHPILYKSIRFYTIRSDSIQIDPILYKSIRFYSNRSDSIRSGPIIQIDPILQIEPIQSKRQWWEEMGG